MASSSILVDSSLWIEALAPRSSGGLTAALRTLLQSRRPIVTEMIRLEVLVGAKSYKEFQQFRDDFAAVPCLTATPACWDLAEDMGFTLGRRGRHVPAADLLIAAVAISYDVFLWHADSDFERIKREFNTLKTLWFPHQLPAV